MTGKKKVYEAAQLLDGEVDQTTIQQAVQQILSAVGEDPQREGLLSTPDRVARAYTELLSGYRTDPVKLINDALFDVQYDDMVIVRVSWICSHGVCRCKSALRARLLISSVMRLILWEQALWWRPCICAP